MSFSRILSRMNFFTKKRVFIILIPCICFLVLLRFQIFSQWWFLKTNFTSLTREPAENEPIAYQCCIPMNKSIRTNLFFLKTHKTGGTTVQSVIVRFARMNSLDVIGVAVNSYYSPFSNSSIRSGTRTPNNKYHVLASHVRYDPRMKLYQYPDTSMVTILRNPVTLFQSLYTYFRIDMDTNMTFQQFLNAPVKPAFLTDIKSSRFYKGYNQMSVDLGFDWAQSENTTAVAEFIAKIDREFDLVMITEDMDESFVLLANLMGWPLENVASLKLNARLPESEPYILTPQDELTIMDLNQVDTQLYKHFLKKFQKCQRQYGEEHMNQQVRQLQVFNEILKDRCVAEEVLNFNQHDAEILVYVPKNLSDTECIYATQLQSARPISVLKSKIPQNNASNSLHAKSKK